MYGQLAVRYGGQVIQAATAVVCRTVTQGIFPRPENCFMTASFKLITCPSARLSTHPPAGRTAQPVPASALNSGPTGSALNQSARRYEVVVQITVVPTSWVHQIESLF